jgi:hypothetical protein
MLCIAEWSGYGGTCSISMDIFGHREILAALQNFAGYLSHLAFSSICRTLNSVVANWVSLASFLEHP